ncbi:MAG: MFS transporter, partial [Gaiellaceae bacterium]
MSLGARAPERSRRGAALASICAVLFLTFLDTTVVSVTLADVQTTLHSGVTQLQWIVDAYMLAFAGLMLAGGTLGDILGRKKVMLAGVALFCAGSLVAALAQSNAVLIAGRVLMGIGAAGSEPGTLSMIRHLYPEQGLRARALGAWTAVSGSALASGPIIGGLLVGGFGWRGVFWLNVGLSSVAFTAAALLLPESADAQERRLDVRGLLL